MPTDGPEVDGPVADQLRRMSALVRELSARIARLATSLGVDLENEAELERVLHIDAGRVPQPDRRVTPDEIEDKALKVGCLRDIHRRTGRHTCRYCH